MQATLPYSIDGPIDSENELIYSDSCASAFTDFSLSLDLFVDKSSSQCSSPGCASSNGPRSENKSKQKRLTKGERNRKKNSKIVSPTVPQVMMMKGEPEHLCNEAEKTFTPDFVPQTRFVCAEDIASTDIGLQFPNYCVIAGMHPRMWGKKGITSFQIQAILSLSFALEVI